MLPVPTEPPLIRRTSDFGHRCPFAREERVACPTRFVKNRLTRNWHADRCTLNIELGTQLTGAHRLADMSARAREQIVGVLRQDARSEVIVAVRHHVKAGVGFSLYWGGVTGARAAPFCGEAEIVIGASLSPT